MDMFSVPSLHGTYLGGVGFPFATGDDVNVVFGSTEITAANSKRSARFSYFELIDVTISGPGQVTTGGGFIGGGFGVSGALEGMAIASILNGLTTRTKIHTFITLTSNFGELHLHYTEMEPGALRVVLAPVFQLLRSSSMQWVNERMDVLNNAKAKGLLNDEQHAQMSERLTREPVWPDPAAEAALRQQEAAERKRTADEHAPKGTCPNCKSVISIYSECCPRCNASFEVGSAWKVKPLAA